MKAQADRYYIYAVTVYQTPKSNLSYAGNGQYVSEVITSALSAVLRSLFIADSMVSRTNSEADIVSLIPFNFEIAASSSVVNVGDMVEAGACLATLK